MDQVHGLGKATLPPTLLLFVAVRSGAMTVTVSLQALSVSLLSVTLLLGSTVQLPPVGFTNVPTAVGLAVNVPSKDPGACLVPPPLAVQVRTLLAMPQLIVPVVL